METEVKGDKPRSFCQQKYTVYTVQTETMDKKVSGNMLPQMTAVNQWTSARNSCAVMAIDSTSASAKVMLKNAVVRDHMCTRQTLQIKSRDLQLTRASELKSQNVT